MVCSSLSLLASLVASAVAAPPHVIFIVADDLGWNDVARHNSNITMPYLDSLEKGGVFLDQYAVYMTCSPTRASLMTGRVPYHLGISKPINTEAKAVSRRHVMLPEALNKLGYRSHLVGKWHLGYYTPKHLPAARGFASSFGFLGGSEDYYTHEEKCDRKNKIYGLDLCSTLPAGNDSATVSAETNFGGLYGTDLLVSKASSVIAQHASQADLAPLFLYMSFQNVHEPIQVPQSYIDRNPSDLDTERRAFSGMVTALDDAVANLTGTLEAHDMLQDSLIIFTTDNGGNIRACGNNWPLRGAKFSMWEGGTRGYSFVYSKSEALIPKQMRGVSVSSITHAADWFATILDASGNLDALPASAADSHSMWSLLTGAGGNSRQQLVHSAHSKQGVLTGKLRSGKYNYYAGYPGLDDWTRVRPEAADKGEGETACASDLGCLFDIVADPNERQNLAEQMPELVAELRGVLENAVDDCPDDCSSDELDSTPPNGWECDAVDKYGCFGPMWELEESAAVV